MWFSWIKLILFSNLFLYEDSLFWVLKKQLWTLLPTPPALPHNSIWRPAHRCSKTDNGSALPGQIHLYQCRPDTGLVFFLLFTVGIRSLPPGPPLVLWVFHMVSLQKKRLFTFPIFQDKYGIYLIIFNSTSLVIASPFVQNIAKRRT